MVAKREKMKIEPDQGKRSRIYPFKYLLFFFILMNLTYASTAQALNLSLGFGAGYRQINDPYLNRVYGPGFIFVPYVQINLSRLVATEISYEGGYQKKAPIGIYQEPSLLKISGLEFSGCFLWPFSQLALYARAGAGYYFYRQDIDSPYVRYHVDHHDFAGHLGLGIELNLITKFLIRSEAKYVYLKVKPFDQRVDLGGWRFLLFLGYKI